MKCCITAVFLLLVGHGLGAQILNLVPNPSFEDYKDLPCSWIVYADDFNNKMGDWSQPTYGSTDIFSLTTESDCYASCLSTNKEAPGQQVPRTGEVMTGIFVYGDGCNAEPNYREYIEVELLEPLEVGRIYYAELYISLADNCKEACSGVGMYFSNDYVSLPEQCGFLELEPYLFAEEPVVDKAGWQKISTVFVADKAARYLIIGNFNTDENTIASPMDNGAEDWNSGVYYYLDDILVRPVEDL